MTVLAAEEAGALAARGAGSAAGARAGARGGAKGARRKPAARGRSRKITPDMSSAEVDEELQRRRAEAADKPESEPTATAQPNPQLPGFMTDRSGAPGWWYQRGDAQKAANAGGGFVLGLFAYALGLTFLRGGMPAVKQLAAAKFFNRTSA